MKICRTLFGSYCLTYYTTNNDLEFSRAIKSTLHEDDSCKKNKSLSADVEKTDQTETVTLKCTHSYHDVNVC